MARTTKPSKAKRRSAVASERAAYLMFDGPGDLSTNPKYLEGFGQSAHRGKRGSLREPHVLRRIGKESKRKGTDKLTSREIDREIAAARRESTRRRPTVGELAGDVIGSAEGPGDLLNNPEHMAGYGKPNRPVHAGEPEAAGKKGTRRSESGRLFISFWHIALENLPVRSFIHRQIAPEDARKRIARARKDAALACCSQDDLLAPYRKDKQDDHRAMCKVLEKHFGVAMSLRDFMTPSDENGSYTTFPLQFADARGSNRLLVVTCMYMMPERRKRRSASRRLDFAIDPESVKFHLFESLHSPRPLDRRTAPRRSARGAALR